MLLGGHYAGGLQVTTITFTSQGDPAGTSGVRFNTDGSLDERAQGVYVTTVHPREWWSTEPQSGIGSSYEIRCASLSSGTWTSEAASVGTWTALSSAREWRNTSATTKQTVGTFEIGRVGTSTALISFTVDIQADGP